jgi:hypothetical protein
MNAGVYIILKLQDLGFRRDDVKRRIWTIYESIIFHLSF